MAQVRYDYLLRVLLVGDAGVGKSCLLSRFMHDQFELAYNLRVGCDLGIKTIEISGHDARIIIWDIAGHERFHTITARNLAYKVKNIHTLARPDTTVVLIGTKADCEPLRQVSSDEGRMFAAEHGKTFLETSALETESDRDNVHTEFMTTLTEVYLNKRYRELDQSTLDSLAMIENRKNIWLSFMPSAAIMPKAAGRRAHLIKSG